MVLKYKKTAVSLYKVNITHYDILIFLIN